MKINLPVSQVERHLKPGHPIVTKTDLKGLITYANAAFVEISGFAAEELLGKNHNVVRHPDMPREAFADLWQTVKAGQPWQGLVRTAARMAALLGRCLRHANQRRRPHQRFHVGAQRPERNAVREAEALYRAVRDKHKRYPATARVRSLARQNRMIWALAVGAAVLAGVSGWLGGTIGGAGALAGALALTSAAYYQQRIGRPLERLAEHIRALDEGHLERRIDTRSGLAQPFSQLEALRIHLRAMFADVLVASREVENRSHDLEQAMASLSQATTSQGERVMQAAAAIEQMSASVNEIAGNTETSADAARATEEAVMVAMRSMNEGIRSSEQVVSVVDMAGAEIGRVNDAVAQIGMVSQIIKDIAEQTNLLALNAAIEAACAGEQGVASRWWPTRCANSPNAPPPRPPTSAARSPASRRCRRVR